MEEIANRVGNLLRTWLEQTSNLVGRNIALGWKKFGLNITVSILLQSAMESIDALQVVFL